MSTRSIPSVEASSVPVASPGASSRRLGFPRALRLRKRREFVAVQDRPALRVRAGSFLVLACRTSDAAPTRLGVVASRRIGGAVVRNRAKRLIRELFRRNRHAWPPGLDLVVVAHASIAGRRLADLERELPRLRRELARFTAAVAPPDAGR